MLNIKFYNESGSIVFGGGGTNTAWRLTEAEGLTFAGKTFTAAKYADSDGQETVAVTANARTITLSGDITAGENFAEQYRGALAVLESPGTLEINTSFGTRRIEAVCCDFKQGERKGKYLIFTVQFICDSPYFEDAEQIERVIFAEVPLLDKTFTFPGSFSERISKSELNYGGSVKTEPVFFIRLNESSGGGALEVHNRTSGESLKFNYSAPVGDCITIDVKGRKIYNADGESLLKYLADDSFFDGFHLFPGVNEIEAVNNNMNVGITAVCRYANKFSEAVPV